MKKLICDRCGREIADPVDIEEMLAGMEAWRASVKAKGEEPRGIFPCEYYARCGGEMIVIDDSAPSKFSQLIKKWFGDSNE